MGNFSEFNSQIQAAEGQINEKWQDIQEIWKGSSADSFKEDIMDKYLKYFEQYKTHLTEISKQIESYQNEMANLTQGL